ncbi:MAG TPA: hypothetical protein VFN82_06410 [Solirubrobacterales bacterium]|nr:hypothetical protein [Solirubrobacterales bacterium]
MTVFDNPLRRGDTVLVGAVGAAEGARGAAAALACAASDVDRSALLIDVGGRGPRPTLIASAAAQRLEERLVAHLPEQRIAARGRICQLSVSPDADGVGVAAAAVAALRGGGGCAIHLPSRLLQQSASHSGLRASAVLLRADLEADRALVALAARDLMDRGLAVAVLKRRLSWAVERRALFGALPEAGALPSRVTRKLLSEPSAEQLAG